MSQIYDLVGIGALNVDLIVQRSGLTKSQLAIVEWLDRSFEPGSEERIPEWRATELVNQLGSTAHKVFGGSAFNVLRGVAATRARLRLGFIGIAGATPDGVPSYREAFAELGMEYEGITECLEQSAGRCISYVDDNDRSLQVAPGANSEILNVLAEKREQLFAILARTRVLHLTSFMSEGAPEGVLAFILDLKRRFPLLTISVDPGHEWCKKHGRTVRELVAVSDLLFLNEREFKLLADLRGEFDDALAASRILGATVRPKLLIVLKRQEHLILFDRSLGTLRSRHYSAEKLEKRHVVDDTGAGDAFASGLLMSFLLPNLDLEDGVQLGQTFARVTMITSGFGGLEYITSSFSKYVSTDAALPSIPQRVDALYRIGERFHLVARQLRTRRAGRPTLEVHDEYDVQDLFHTLLRLVFDDVRAEEWTPSYAGGTSRMDFLLPEIEAVVEIKKSRQGLSAREVGEQLMIDIARYQKHPSCRTLFCFVYDPDNRIANPRGIENDLNTSEDSLTVRVLIAP